ncbi:MAG TPA: hypothetical protein VFO67_05295 [Gemmatimonadales bacterium]|nr:hypothetical protein [Gemmatimonadales bacterium]
MSRTDLAWLAVAAYALHIMEERLLDWLGSARRSLQITMEQDNYRLIEGVFLILGAVAAMVAASLPRRMRPWFAPSATRTRVRSAAARPVRPAATARQPAPPPR